MSEKYAIKASNEHVIADGVRKVLEAEGYEIESVLVSPKEILGFAHESGGIIWLDEYDENSKFCYVLLKEKPSDLDSFKNIVVAYLPEEPTA